MIPQIEPWIDNSELDQLKRVITSTYLTESIITAEFEAGLRALTGARHAVATTNGTTALYCAMKALGVGHGDEVIVPDLTFIATSNSVIMAGAKPVFCEVMADTLCLDARRAEELITPRTKAIMPVHLYGQSADMDAVMALAQRHDLRVIEDAAQAIGVRFKGEHVGLRGDASAISFYGNKTITCGEGGVILTQSDAVATACNRLKNHGRDARGTFIHEHIGFNFAITELQAAIGVAQMAKLSRIVERKREIFESYARGLSDVRQLVLFDVDPRCAPVYWFTSFRAERRAELALHLHSHGVQTRRFFCPLHQQPCYADMAVDPSCFPISSAAYETGISLPSSYSLKPIEQEYVIDRIREFYGA